MRNETFKTRTEVVGVEQIIPFHGERRRKNHYGIVTGRATTEQGEGLVGVEFFDNPDAIPTYVPEADTDAETFEVSVEVQHELETIEDCALAFVQWMLDPGEVFVDVKGVQSSKTFTVKVTVGEDGNLTAERMPS